MKLLHYVIGKRWVITKTQNLMQPIEFNKENQQRWHPHRTKGNILCKVLVDIRIKGNKVVNKAVEEAIGMPRMTIQLLSSNY